MDNVNVYLGCIVSLWSICIPSLFKFISFASFVEDGVRNKEHNQWSRNTVLYKFGVSILNIWPSTSRNRPSMHRERYKPIRLRKTNPCAAANFKIETLQDPAKTIYRSKLIIRVSYIWWLLGSLLVYYFIFLASLLLHM